MVYDTGDNFFKKALERLTERAKELNCLYHLEELLISDDSNYNKLFPHLIEIIPQAFQYPTICEVRIEFEGKLYTSVDYKETPWSLRADLIVDNNEAGFIKVNYMQLVEQQATGIFLPEEQKLINTIANRVSEQIFFSRLKRSLDVLESQISPQNGEEPILKPESDAHWKWRYHMSELIASLIDPVHFGVEAMYLIGSTKNATAGPGSDIDIMLHFKGNLGQLAELKAWIGGWSYCLSEMNYQKTGYPTNGLIDLHIITDEDIINKTSFAIMINDPNNRARPLRMGEN